MAMHLVFARVLSAPITRELLLDVGHRDDHGGVAEHRQRTDGSIFDGARWVHGLRRIRGRVHHLLQLDAALGFERDARRIVWRRRLDVCCSLRCRAGLSRPQPVIWLVCPRFACAAITWRLSRSASAKSCASCCSKPAPVIDDPEKVRSAHLSDFFPPPVGGSEGFFGVPKYTNLFWVYAFLAITVVAAYRLKQSGLGRAMISACARMSSPRRRWESTCRA